MNRNTVSGYVPLVHCCNTVKCVQMSKYDFNYVHVDFHKKVCCSIYYYAVILIHVHIILVLLKTKLFAKLNDLS